MARFKRRARRYARSFGRSFRRSRKNMRAGVSPMNVVLAGAVYGAARPYVANVLPNMFSFGPVDSDNAIIGALGFYGMTRQTGFMRALGAVTLGSEAAIVANKLAAGGMTTSSTTTGGWI